LPEDPCDSAKSEREDQSSDVGNRQQIGDGMSEPQSEERHCQKGRGEIGVAGYVGNNH
jgi:hypothetical protein